MGKQSTKAEIVLQGARDRIETARREVEAAEDGLSRALFVRDTKLAVLGALTAEYSALETSLTSVKRKVRAPKSAPAAPRRSSGNTEQKEPTASSVASGESVGSVTGQDGEKCAICGTEELSIEHDKDLEGYHKYRTEIKKKRGKDNVPILPENPEDFQHGATA